MTITADAQPLVITDPGIYSGLPEDAYHADPVPAGSLSQSGAKKLLPPSCPARFRYEREHPPAPSSSMELGTAAHKLVLGSGPVLEVVQAEHYRAKASQEQAKIARSEGRLPLLTHEYAKVIAMADAVRRHPLASRLFDPGSGSPEQSEFWFDQRFGVWRRCRFDWLPDAGSGRLIIPDFKTSSCADPDAFAKSVANYGYHMQEPWYTDGAAAMFPGADIAFVFVVQETTPPYLVSVIQLDEDAVAVGRRRNERALEIYRDCTASGIWPGHQPDGELSTISLPRWAARGESW